MIEKDVSNSVFKAGNDPPVELRMHIFLLFNFQSLQPCTDNLYDQDKQVPAASFALWILQSVPRGLAPRRGIGNLKDSSLISKWLASQVQNCYAHQRISIWRRHMAATSILP